MEGRRGGGIRGSCLVAWLFLLPCSLSLSSGAILDYSVNSGYGGSRWSVTAVRGGEVGGSEKVVRETVCKCW